MDEDRRQLLATIGVGGGLGLGALVGLNSLSSEDPSMKPGTPTDTATDTESTASPEESNPVRHSEKFGTVVDAVAAGADPNGERPVNDVLEGHAADDTLISFEDGTYRLEPIDLSGYRRLGLAAAGSTRPTFVGDSGHCVGGGSSYVSFDGVEGLLLDRLRFDFTGDSTGGIIRIGATGDATVTNLTASGRCEGQVAQFRLDVLDSDATAVVDHLQMDSQVRDEWFTGVYVGKPHAGRLVFRNCNVQGFTDNGLYASAPGLEDGAGGTVHVEGGTFRNNNVANVRLGSAGSTATDVTSSSDTPPPSAGQVTANARGFRLRSGRGQLIEDCRVRITANSKFTHGGIVFHETNGGATVRGTSVEIDRNDTPAIRLFPRNNDHTEVPVFEDVHATGDADGGEALMVSGRDETVVRNCRIDQSGTQRNGLVLRDSADCLLVDSYIDVSKNPLILRDSNVLIRNTTLVTPDGTEEITERAATDGDFTPRGAE